jgi:hypothetical protein
MNLIIKVDFRKTVTFISDLIPSDCLSSVYSSLFLSV